MNMIFLSNKEKEAEIHTKVQYVLAFTEFVSHRVSNASSRYLQKKSVSCIMALMSHFTMKGQDFTFQQDVHFSLFRFFSLYVLSSTMIFFLFNWLVSSSLFFLRAFPYLKRKRNVVLLGISPFSSSPM